MDQLQPYLNLAALQQYLPVLGKLLPRAAKYLGLLVLALNLPSLPFGWHIRVFSPLFHLRFRFLLFRLSLLLRSREERKKAKDKWLENLSPIGENPFEKTIIHNAWAGIDDCDYNLHLSNSCYPKVLDCARFKAALAYFPTFLRAGGWIALGATHFNFIREIPIFSPYQVRMSIASWDNKWMFLVIRFVTFPKKTKGSDKKAHASKTPPTSTTDGPPFLSLHTPASGLTTPAPALVSAPASAPASASASSGIPGAAAAMRALAAQTTEPDGATLNCLSVNELVFKHGRITVPPALVLAGDGFAAPPPDADLAGGAAPYSAANPPPHWAAVQALLRAGGVRGVREFIRGGWRAVPEGARWWEAALGGAVEEQRAANYELVKGVRRGMEGAREVVQGV